MLIKYRPDIDGLRAIAVIPVILFHADYSLFSGGYVGVDIFFVISGYLITNILLKDIKNNRFSIVTFYERRIRRIFPALFFVLFFSSSSALWLLLPDELYEYGKSLIAATFFYSNYYFMFDAGYFAAPSETKALLHMWSLAVEEQFYIVFPIYLYLVSRYLTKYLRIITITAFILSLVYSIVLINIMPGDAFYSAHARAWELIAGSLLALFPRNRQLDPRLANLVSIVGLSSILYAILFYSKSTLFPGAAALLPVIGTSMIIYVGCTNQNIVGSVLSTPIFRFFGLISYSLYLWHWPVLVYYRFWNIQHVSKSVIASLIIAIIIISYLTWKYVEMPFRTRNLLPRQKKIIFTGGSVMLVSALFGVTLVIGQGFPERFPDRINTILTAKNDRPERNECGMIDINSDSEVTSCYVGDINAESITFAVWGDSHGKAILPGIHDSAVKYQRKGVFVGRGGCLPLLEVYQVRQGYENCTDTANAFIAYLSEHPEIKEIILVSRWAIYAMGQRFKNEKGYTVYIRDSNSTSVSLDENQRVFKRSFERTMASLALLGRRVIIMTQVPETEYNIPSAAARSTVFGHNIELRPLASEYLTRQAYVSEVFNSNYEKFSFMLVQPHDIMCNENYCSVFKDDIPIYRDSNHITKSYAVNLSKIFDPVFLSKQTSMLH